MLRRALSNLLSNAIRHTPAHGGVRVTVNGSADWTTIAVENDGETIPPEHLERLFDRFYRADPSRHRASDGAGLGLAITKSIVTAHGGAITADSSDGKSRFTVTLPATERAI
jgi:two-component system heavy metal sensor histidine kinase CusS